MPPSSSKPSRPKASEVASETRRYYIPMIRKQYGDCWPPVSYLYQAPLQQLPITRSTSKLTPPTFFVALGDPVDFALNWGADQSTRMGQAVRIPFICAANDRRPGGDWETGVVGYEERLCRRSNLSATLGTPGPGSNLETNYPIPIEGGIFSEHVVVFRGPHDRYEKKAPEEWMDIPVVSIPPTRWPKLNPTDARYSFDEERETVKNKMRGALRICLYNNYNSVVIGDFGLGNSYRNPPQELAELWREVFLYDPELRGKFRYAAFVFEDNNQSTMKNIFDDFAKKANKPVPASSGKGKGKGKGRASSSSGGSGPSSAQAYESDYQIFERTFDNDEIRRVLSSPDPRYGLSMITTPP